MRRIFVGVALALGLADAANAGGMSGGGVMLPNADIRAMVPPIDVTPEQLRAQGTLPAEGRSIYRRPSRHRHLAPVLDQ